MSSADPGVWQASPPLHGTLVLVRPARFAAVLVCAAIAGGSGCSEPALEADESAVVCPVDDPDCDRIDEPCVMDETPAADLEPGSSPMGLGGPLTGGGKHQIWPKGRVPYKVGSTVNSTTKSRLLSAMKEWETKTKSVVRFEAATSADKAHVLVSEGSPRVAFVGYRAGTVSNLYLRDSEYLTVTRHELGHVLGLEHEHRRKDRANQIQVISSNIVNTSLCKYQFALCTDCALLDKYTVKSVMHYRSTRDLTSCRVGGKAVLLTKSGALINHEWLIATGDIESIYELYGSPVTGSGGSGGTGGSKDAGLTGGTGGTADAGRATRHRKAARRAALQEWPEPRVREQARAMTASTNLVGRAHLLWMARLAAGPAAVRAPGSSPTTRAVAVVARFPSDLQVGGGCWYWAQRSGSCDPSGAAAADSLRQRAIDLGHRRVHALGEDLGGLSHRQIELEVRALGGRQLDHQLVELAPGQTQGLERGSFELFGLARESVGAGADQPAQRVELHAAHARAAHVVVDPRLVGVGRELLEHARHHAAVLLNFPLRVAVDAQLEEVLQVVQIDLPVPLGIGRERQVDARELPRHLLVGHPLVGRLREAAGSRSSARWLRRICSAGTLWPLRPWLFCTLCV